MLTTLRIKNLALVAELTLELRPGFNVITGETGAGKSILLGALHLLLGERADRTLIRAGAEACTVEAAFDISTLRAPVKAFLEENGLEPCEENQILLKRTFTTAGANRQFINGSPTTLQTLAHLGDWLVDMHGPHDHQSLLQPARQLAILDDAFGGLETARERFASLIQRHSALKAAKSALVLDEKTYAQQLDLLRHQVNEIQAARLQTGEETRMEQDHQRASNAARLIELGQTALGLLAEEENTSLMAQFRALGRMLQELQRMDPDAAPLAELQQHAGELLAELQAGLSRYADRVDLNPARLTELEERLNLLHSLKRKYGATAAEVIAFGEAARLRLQSLESRDTELARLNAELMELGRELEKAGQALTAARHKLIPKLAKSVCAQLAALGFQQSQFNAVLSRIAAASSSGFDQIEFLFAPNPGEPARPLRAIASSGEMARVMLALKTVLAAEDEVPVLIFDEVDANIGGETAHGVGAKMRQIAAQRQVLCITHLAPVAAAAAAHYVVRKEVKGERTLTEMQLLGNPERVTELARMLGGQSDAARRHAQELLRPQDFQLEKPREKSKVTRVIQNHSP